MKFELGQLVITANAQAKLNVVDVLSGVKRHAAGDWGDICAEDAISNEWALKNGERLMSVYRDRGGEKFWVVTEADRSVTTVLLPEDY